jgi:recombinational DNA repair protein RecR
MTTLEALAMRRLRNLRKSLGTCIYCGQSKDTETMCFTCADKKRRSSVPAEMRNTKRYPVARQSVAQKPKALKD